MRLLGALAAAVAAIAAEFAFGHDAGDWTIRLSRESAGGGHEALATRLTAARELLRAKLGDIGSTETLLAAWIATRPDVMAVSPEQDSETLVAICVRPSSVDGAASALSGLVRRYGMPIVAFEPERPTSAEDRRLAMALQAAVAEAGLRTVDGTAARESRRAAVDRAVHRGLDEPVGRATLDHLDTDFIARIESRTPAPRREEVYGVDLHVVERLSVVTLMRAQVDSVVTSWQDTTLRRSRSLKAAERDAEDAAIVNAVVPLLSAIAQDWIAIASGTRPWLVEILHPRSDIPRALDAAGDGTIKVLEHRPGIRAVIEVAHSDLPRLGESLSLGPAIRHRPGTLLVAPESTMRPPAWIVGAASVTGLSIAVVSLYLLRSRAKRRAHQFPP